MLLRMNCTGESEKFFHAPDWYDRLHCNSKDSLFDGLNCCCTQGFARSEIFHLGFAATGHRRSSLLAAGQEWRIPACLPRCNPSPSATSLSASVGPARNQSHGRHCLILPLLPPSPHWGHRLDLRRGSSVPSASSSPPTHFLKYHFVPIFAALYFNQGHHTSIAIFPLWVYRPFRQWEPFPLVLSKITYMQLLVVVHDSLKSEDSRTSFVF